MKENPCIGTDPDADPCPHCGTALSDQCPYENTVDRKAKTFTLTRTQVRLAQRHAIDFPKGNIAGVMRPNSGYILLGADEVDD